MSGKIARSPPRPPFGLPDAPVAVRTSRLSCGKAGKARIFTQFGIHPGNPGPYKFVLSSRVLYNNLMIEIVNLGRYRCMSPANRSNDWSEKIMYCIVFKLIGLIELRPSE